MKEFIDGVPNIIRNLVLDPRSVTLDEILEDWDNVGIRSSYEEFANIQSEGKEEPAYDSIM